MIDRFNILGIGRIIAAIVLPITLVLGFVNEIYFSKWVLPRSVLPILGMLLVTIGVILVFLSGIQLQKGLEKGKLVTDGLYAYIRNPLYAGWIFFIIPGIVLIFGLLFLIPIPFLTYALFRYLIGIEESELEKRYGNEYLNYKKKVNSIFPKLKRY